MDNKFNNTLDLLWCGRVAQLAEQCPFKAWVDGSSPSALTRYPFDFIAVPAGLPFASILSQSSLCP
jgi:hypothetical protein